MLQIVVLICAMSTDGAACQPDTAIDVIRGARVSSPQQCVFQAQAQLATTALKPTADQYVKIVCQHERDAAER